MLRHGGLVAYPTDTLYGLGSDALNEAAVERVYREAGHHPLRVPHVPVEQRVDLVLDRLAEASGQSRC